MSDILGSLRARAAQRADEAHRTVLEIARRDVAGIATDDDSQRLAAALEDAGKSHQDYANILSLFRQHAELVTAASGIDAAEAAAISAAHERDAVRAEYVRELNAKDAHSRHLADVAHGLSVELKRKQEAGDALRTLERQRPDLFGDQP